MKITEQELTAKIGDFLDWLGDTGRIRASSKTFVFADYQEYLNGGSE